MDRGDRHSHNELMDGMRAHFLHNMNHFIIILYYIAALKLSTITPTFNSKKWDSNIFNNKNTQHGKIVLLDFSL